MIQTTLVDDVQPLRDVTYALTARIEVCECNVGETEEVKASRVVIGMLWEDMDQLKFTYMSMIFWTLELQEFPEIPLVTTGDVMRVTQIVDPKSKAVTDE